MENTAEKPALEVVKDAKTELVTYRKQFEKEWRELDDAYYGKQHKTGEGKKTVKNHIFKVIEGEVPILTDSMPGTQVTANISTKQEDADILNKGISYVYQDQNLPLILPSLVRSGCMSAPGFLYAYYNPDAAGGDGKIEYLELDWENVWLDGNSGTIEGSSIARWKVPTRRGAAARKWVEKSEEIMQSQSSEAYDQSRDDGNFETRDVSDENDRMGKPKKASAKDIVSEFHNWILDYSTEQIPADETTQEVFDERNKMLSGEPARVHKWQDHENHMGDHKNTRAEATAQLGLGPEATIDEVVQAVQMLMEQNPEAAEQFQQIPLIVQIIDNHIAEHTEMQKLNPKGERPKYPDGWRVIITIDDKVVTYDGPNPEQRSGIGHIPIIPFYCYKDKTIYGFGEAKNIIDMQRSLNDVDFRELESLRVSANPGWVYDAEAGVEGKITNAPGVEIKKAKGTTVSRLEPGMTSPQLAARRESDINSVMDISGINEASQGQLPASSSGIAITKLQTQAIGRIRLKDRYLQGYSIRRLAIITASLILNHWTTEKNFRLRGDNNKIEDVVFDPIRLQDLEYTVEIAPGSMAGIDKDSLNTFFLNLLQGQHIDFEAFLKVADFPKKEILQTWLKEKMGTEQSVKELQAEIQRLVGENSAIRGLVSPTLLNPESKKLFEAQAQQALFEKITAPQPGNQMDPAMQGQADMGNPGALSGQPENQG